MNRNSAISFDEAAKYGIVAPQARMWVNPADPASLSECAMDAALVTTPNTSVPVEFLAYLDPMIIDILFAPRRAREIYGEVKKGDWTTAYAKFRVNEMTGKVTGYSDYGSGGKSGVNYNWPSRAQFLFQTVVSYGDLETAMSAEAKINLASDKQRSAANTIDMASNKFYLLGVDGHEIYGALNDPNLSAAIVAASVTPAGGGVASTAWDDKTTKQIYEDVLALFKELQAQTKSIVTRDTPLKLLLPPEKSVMLGKATDFNISAEDMLNKFFAKLTVVVLPELSSLNGGDAAMLVADNLLGQKTGELGYGDKFRPGRIIPELSSFKQKFVGTTYGAITYQPAAVATMTGI